MRIILCEKGTLRHLSRQMKISLNTATRSVYVLRKAPNVVIYILHRQTPKIHSWHAVIYGICKLESIPNAVSYSIRNL